MSETKKNSILVIDDENSNILILTQILSPEYTVYAAKNGQDAIAAAKKYMPDIILLDIIMPDMDGYEVISALKNLEKIKDIPVIFVSGLNSAGDEEKGLDFGVADYITKPFSPAIVKLRVKNQIKLIEQFRAAEYDILKYKLANDALKIALWDMDVANEDLVNSNNRFTWSQEFRSMLGFSSESEFPNVLRSWSERLHPEDKDRTLNAFTAHINDKTGKTIYDIEYRLMMKNGEYRYFKALGTTFRDSTGVPLRVAGALMDITEKKQMEEGALEDEERMRLMINTMPLACSLISRDHKFLTMNKASMFLFGVYDETENLTEKYLEMLPEFQPCGRSSLELTYEYIEKAFEEGYQQFEWLYVRPDGEVIPCEDTLIRVRYRGKYILAGYARDLREQKAIIEEIKKAEIAEESNKAKSQFLANMSHEMRTPLNVVVGLTDLILDEDNLAVNLKENLLKINTAGNTLLGLINDVLDISKIEAGKFELVPVNYEISSLLNDIITLNMIRIEEKPIKFILDLKEDMLANLCGDDLRVKQIINNILSNAFKYTEKGTVTLGISCNVEAENVWLSIYVSDTGRGIREDDLNKLFTDYGQVDTHMNRKIEGTGLGLSITKRLTEMMEGEISAESEYSKGSVFRIRIRQGFVNNKTIGPTVVKNLCSFRYEEDKCIVNKKIVRPDLSFAQVLVVDDMQTNLDVATGLLSKYKLKVDCVLSGKEAIERIQKGLTSDNDLGYNVIFMDHMMPGMDGIETASAIRAIGTEYAKKIPIIALTANAIQGTEEMFYANNFQGFLTKPINILQLDSVVRKWIKK